MTDDATRLDARVRRALTTLPAPDQAETRAALRTVLERSTEGRPDRSASTRWWGAPLAAAAAVGVVAATITVGTLITNGSDQQPPLERPAPGTPVGTWERLVSASGAGTVSGTWTMTLTPEGVLRLTGPAGAPSSEGASYSTDGRRVRVDAFVNNVCAELPAGTYGWTVAAGDLTLSLLDDPCSPRADLFSGTWRSVP